LARFVLFRVVWRLIHAHVETMYGIDNSERQENRADQASNADNHDTDAYPIEIQGKQRDVLSS
jgi:hypothetical protein